MTEADPLIENARAWLLAHPEPGVRYLALRDLAGLPENHADLVAARNAAYAEGPIAAVLSAMQPDGFWVVPGPGYHPKYTSTAWALILLAQLGAQISHEPRRKNACAYLLDHALTENGLFSVNGSPSQTIDCLQGNLCWALASLGCEDTRMEAAYEWMARSVTGEGVVPPLRYHAYKCGPLFACGVNNKEPCAWGGVKVMLAFSQIPPARRTPLMEKAIQVGMDFLLDNHPEQAGYPSGPNNKPSGSWFRFGFPVFYVTDVLQIAEAAAALGYAADPRLNAACRFILSKRDSQGLWPLEYDYAGKTYGNFGAKKKANPWVTLRALRVLKARGQSI